MGEHILLCSRYLVHLLRGSGACLERGDRRVRALHRARKVNAERHRRGIQFEDADELLNEKLFLGLGHARSAVAEWVADDNTNRPHFARSYQTPAAFAAQLTAMDGRLHEVETFRRSLIAPSVQPGDCHLSARVPAR